MSQLFRDFLRSTGSVTVALLPGSPEAHGPRNVSESVPRRDRSRRPDIAGVTSRSEAEV